MKQVASQQLSFYFPIEEKAKLQERANRIPLVLKDLANIQKTLPILLPHQAENVYKTETRFFNPPDIQLDGINKGIMFTDGTGTGKTFVGLGIMKRFKRLMIDDILVVVPTDAKVKDWIEDGKYFGMNLRQLKDTKDGGYTGSIVITTYANFRVNKGLLARAERQPFGLVIYDECHKIQSNEAGAFTDADSTHKRLTNSPDEALAKATVKYASLKGKEDPAKLQKLIQDEARRLVMMTRVVFLSATPFSYHKNLIYADGYLFKIRQGENGRSDESYKEFFVKNFGYRLQHYKLIEPDAAVDVGLFERQFHTKLVAAGVVSSTRLQLDKDYSREFILIDDTMGLLIDEGYQIASDRNLFKFLPEIIEEKFTWLYKNQLLECIKAKRIIDRIRQHLELGRKVVVFHSYNNSLPSHPFDFADEHLFRNLDKKKVSIRNVIRDVELFYNKYPQYVNMDLSNLTNPIDTIQKAFKDRVVTFNGTVPARERTKVKKLFNDDYSGKDVFVVQMEAGKEGISLHDTTGVKQRVSINLALPTKPTDAIQSEGRIYRIGQKSDAIIEYPVLHLNFEKSTFSEKINERVKTAENLAFGEQARNLKEAFKEGYKNPITDPPHAGQGKGSRDADMVFDTIDDYTMAIKLYFNRGRRNAMTIAKEGPDYYATPEPIGYKMVQWLYPSGNDHLLEPSAGHGAIARYFPENTVNKFVEPSYQLRADLSINATGVIIPSTFQELNIINKFKGIAMNPPSCPGGSTAIQHLEKAMRHLEDGGRIVAILPENTLVINRLEKLGKRSSNIENDADFFVTGRVDLPLVAFRRAESQTFQIARSMIVVIDKQRTPEVQKQMPKPVYHDLSMTNDVNDLFERIKGLEMPGKITPQYTAGLFNGVSGDLAQVVPGIHTKYKTSIWTVKLLRTVNVQTFNRMNNVARQLGGYYSDYTGNRAIPGFIFKEGPDGANKLAKFINSL